jgi:CMP/dCMP kinase
MTSRTAITIAYQLGSGGAYIGQTLASRFGLKYVDREIVHLVAQALSVDEEDIVARQERLSSFVLTTWSVFAIPFGVYSSLPPRHISDRELFNKQAEILKDIAGQEDCVIVGWAGSYILPHHAGTTHIFLHAPVQFRIQRMMEIHQVASIEQAERMIKESDSMRKRYFTEMTGKDWTFADNYHLSFDTSVISLPEITEMIIDFIQRKTNRESV